MCVQSGGGESAHGQGEIGTLASVACVSELRGQDSPAVEAGAAVLPSERIASVIGESGALAKAKEVDGRDGEAPSGAGADPSVARAPEHRQLRERLERERRQRGANR